MKNFHVENIYPYVCGGIVTLCYIVFFWESPISENFSHLLTASLSISAIAIGFIATSKSILLAMEDRRAVQHIKEMGLYTTMIEYMMGAIHFSFIHAVLSALGLVIDLKNPEWWFQFAFASWIFIGSTSLVLCYRVIGLLAKIMRANS